MSGAPVLAPEVLVAQCEPHNAYLDESALDDDSDSEIDVSLQARTHASSAHRFSLRQSQNASQIEMAGILTTKERRASRRESQAAREREAEMLKAAGAAKLDNDVDRRMSSTSSAGPENLSRSDVPSTSASALSSPSPANLLKSDLGLGFPARRLSRTAQIIAEERGTGTSTGTSTGTNTQSHPLSQGITIPSPPVGFTSATIKEVDSIPPTPAAVESVEPSTFEVIEEDPRATGKIASWRGATILATACFAQLIDNIWMTSINIAVPRIAEEFELLEGSQSWLVSAYTLTFGGFLLLAGVLSDRFGRRYVFSLGMLWMTVFSIACGVSRTGVQCIIFRALQGLGAAASVPSAIGVLSNFFVGKERHRALSMFGAAGAVGFVVGLILGGILSGTLGWRYIFYVNAPIICVLAISGWISFPKEREDRMGRKPSLDFPGAALGTSGMVLMTFALSQSEVSGWNKPLILVTLILSFVFLFFSFLLLCSKTGLRDSVFPTYLWKLPSFAGIWCSGFLLYCWWASVVYYLTLISQEVLFLTPLTTGLYMIPMGATGFIVSMAMGRAVEKFELKHLLVAGFFVSVVGTLPAAFVKAGGNFWGLVFPTTLFTVTGVSIAYNVASIALVSAVPPAAKSLAGGLINTAFQIGSGFGLAITSLVNENVLKKTLNPEDPSSIMKGYQAALFTSCGLVGGSLILSVFAIRAGQRATAGMIVH
ncbi:MFS general substrate transporter [Dendrothele bispora CBS 962.96]|uniref:MFS general substrate transporter n=1 Tax=Dendrothele bispora (strain CBS 962.96) TaxID=1314807 RepID=A0A4S8LGV8_DENBC|nr:MFS general substrate transporter [Dendrothele bispora CBS 962.96]